MLFVRAIGEVFRMLFEHLISAIFGSMTNIAVRVSRIAEHFSETDGRVLMEAFVNVGLATLLILVGIFVQMKNIVTLFVTEKEAEVPKIITFIPVAGNTMRRIKAGVRSVRVREAIRDISVICAG